MSRAALAFLILTAACGTSPRAADGTHTADLEPSPTVPPPSEARATIKLTGTQGQVAVSAEVVASPGALQRGLMYRNHLPPDDGMLFLMGDEDDHSFWMHNTLIPLDIIFITRDLTVAGVSANATPQTDTHRSVGVPSLYVLETNGGWCAKHGIAAGAKVAFEGVERAAH
jgi:hypothetical protein